MSDVAFPSQVSAVSPLDGTAIDGSRIPRASRRRQVSGTPGSAAGETTWQC
jgi:hypothetical protein